MNNEQIQLLKDSITENLQANEQIDTKSNKMNLYDYLCDVVLVFKETAEKMNMPLGTIKSRTHRAKQKIKEFIERVDKHAKL